MKTGRFSWAVVGHLTVSLVQRLLVPIEFPTFLWGRDYIQSRKCLAVGDLNLVQLELDDHLGEGSRQAKPSVVEQMIEGFLGRLNRDGLHGVPYVHTGQLLALVRDPHHR